MSLTGQPSSSRSAEKAPAERLTPLARRDLEIANLERQVRDLRQQNDELWSEHEDLKAKGTSWVTLLEDLKAREDDFKAKEEIIKGLSTDLAKQESETNSYKEHNVELQDMFRKHHEEVLAATERHQLRVANARKVMDKESDFVPLADSKKAETKERAEPPQPQQSSSDILAGTLEPENVSKDANEGQSETVKTVKDKGAHSTGSKARKQKVAESTKPSEHQTLNVDDSSMTRKRSFSQTSSVSDHSQKKPRSNRREASPPTKHTCRRRRRYYADSSEGEGA